MMPEPNEEPNTILTMPCAIAAITISIEFEDGQRWLIKNAKEVPREKTKRRKRRTKNENENENAENRSVKHKREMWRRENAE